MSHMQASSCPAAAVPPPAPSAVRQWHLSIRAQFAVLGLAMGAWGAQVPAVKQHYGLDEGELAIALLAAAAGAVLCLLSAGALVARFGARHCVRSAGVLMCAVLVAVLQFESYGVLLALMLLLGAGSALFDVSINSDGNHLETRSGRKVMSGLHAMFSLGGMAGALLSAGLYRAALPAAAQLAVVGLVLAPFLLWAALPLTNERADSEEAPAPLAWPRGVLLWMGVLTSLCMVAEGAMYDWSALYVHQELRTNAALGALGFAAFSAAMAFGRLFGDWVRGHLAPVTLLLWSGALAAVGMVLALAVGSPWAALLGFMLVGLGLANVVPVLFAAAGQVAGVPPAQGVAAVSSVGYLGFMIGPALIGALAHASTLSAALWVVAVFAVLMALAARRVLGLRR
jgi:fucose permease